MSSERPFRLRATSAGEAWKKRMVWSRIATRAACHSAPEPPSVALQQALVFHNGVTRARLSAGVLDGPCCVAVAFDQAIRAWRFDSPPGGEARSALK
jgi:hypothetical protein